MSEFIGPAFPQVYDGSCTENPDGQWECADTDILKDRDPSLASGCTLRRLKECNVQEEVETQSADFIGPCTPSASTDKRPNVDQNECADNKQSFGPVLPPGFCKQTPDASTVSCGKESIRVDDNDEEIIGPLPPTQEEEEHAWVQVATDVEQRAQAMKNKLLGLETEEPHKLEREEWMMELPPALSNAVGVVTARKFRTKPPLSEMDRSGWTETPNAKEKKESQQAAKRKMDPAEVALSQRDEEMATYVQTYNSARKDSLMDLHTKKKKKEEKEVPAVPNERRPFDREIYLQSNRFDNAMKQQIIKRSQQLDSRFSHGEKTQHFL